MRSLEKDDRSASRSLEHYGNASIVLKNIASHIFSVEISDETVQNWWLAMRLIKRVDDCLDSKEEAGKLCLMAFLENVFLEEETNNNNENLDGELMNSATDLRSRINEIQA
jgi:hypothetical protein